MLFFFCLSFIKKLFHSKSFLISNDLICDIKRLHLSLTSSLSDYIVDDKDLL